MTTTCANHDRPRCSAECPGWRVSRPIGCVTGTEPDPKNPDGPPLARVKLHVGPPQPLQVGACHACGLFSDDAAALAHVIDCAPCADRAAADGAEDVRFGAFAGLEYFETVGGLWWAEIRTRAGGLVRQTALYPDREGARAAGMAWLRLLRGGGEL